MMGASQYLSFKVERMRVVVPSIDPNDLDGGAYFGIPRGDAEEHIERHNRNETF